MADGESKRRAFVVWDSSAHGVKTNLELLRRNPPAGLDVEVLGLDRKSAGAIWTSYVEPAIRAAEIALALIDLPNANVGFEIGFALGLAGSGRDDVQTKRVRLVAAGGQVPPWLDRPPFQHQLVAPASKLSELAASPGQIRRRCGDPCRAAATLAARPPRARRHIARQDPLLPASQCTFLHESCTKRVTCGTLRGPGSRTAALQDPLKEEPQCSIRISKRRRQEPVVGPCSFSSASF